MRSWRRIAIVSDTAWLAHTMQALGWLVPGEARVFPMESLDEARTWVSE
jgi:hypothetical protein